ncbi:innexin inx2-like [Varroa jacobsoni]|uniref:innexin inx2-like n=1 Tax=Varroa jacobsoni TaxID=62625 RepID=UPI000BF2CDF0|nr:innexin inx2-like [Varroa jacobsoni]
MELLTIAKGLLSFKPDKVLIDNIVFRLHYRFTSLLLLGCSILVTSYQFFGDPIDCITRNSVRPELLDRYCWVQKTFSIPSQWHGQVGSQVVFPGVSHSRNDDVVYHAYYQWVCFVLLFQAVLFYTPHYMWKTTEGGRLKNIVREIRGSFSEPKKMTKVLYPVVYCMQNGINLRYGLGYVLCEMLNLVNVVGQTYLMDRFLGGEFFKYGLQVISFTEWSQEIRYDPMIKLFPRVTKCTFRTFGSSGDVEITDHMCLLSVNIINEKVYLLLWFWFFGLTLITLLSVLYRVAVLLNLHDIRYKSLSRPGFAGNKRIHELCRNMSVGDFLFLSLVMENVDRLSYNQFITNLAKLYEDHGIPSSRDKETNDRENHCKINFSNQQQHDYKNQSFRSTDM